MPALQRVAFVAMKFTNDPWRDQRYVTIREVLEEVGYSVVRGDEVESSGAESSGAVVDEVLKLLREADCVVFATSVDCSATGWACRRR